MGNTESSSEWSATYDEIKCKHDAAYAVIESGIRLEEQGNPQEVSLIQLLMFFSLSTFKALEKYKEGIKIIDSALSVQVTCPENPDISWEKAIVMIQKMKKTRGEVLSRINSIQISDEPEEPREQPPSYDEAMASTPTSSTPQTYNDLANALHQMTISNVDTDSTMEAEVVYMYDNVKLYFISSSGEVSSTLVPQTLKIILVESMLFLKLKL